MKKCPISLYEVRKQSLEQYRATPFANRKGEGKHLFDKENYALMMCNLPTDIAQKIKQEEMGTLWRVEGLPFKAYAIAWRNNASGSNNGYIVGNGWLARLVMKQYLIDSGWDNEYHKPIHVHGGWTMKARPVDNWLSEVAGFPEIESDGIQTIAGFDTAHCNDLMPTRFLMGALMNRPPRSPWPEEAYRDVRYVREELADALVELKARCSIKNILRLIAIKQLIKVSDYLRKVAL